MAIDIQDGELTVCSLRQEKTAQWAVFSMGSGRRDRTFDQSLTLILSLLKGADYIILVACRLRDLPYEMRGFAYNQHLATSNRLLHYVDSLYTFPISISTV